MSKTFNQNYNIRLKHDKFNLYTKQCAKLHQQNMTFKSEIDSLTTKMNSDTNDRQKKNDLKKVKDKYYSNQRYMYFLKRKMDRIAQYIEIV